jgi:hypothetical protein
MCLVTLTIVHQGPHVNNAIQVQFLPSLELHEGPHDQPCANNEAELTKTRPLS